MLPQGRGGGGGGGGAPPPPTTGVPIAVSLPSRNASVCGVSTGVLSANLTTLSSTPLDSVPDCRSRLRPEVDSTETTRPKRPLFSSAVDMAGIPATTTVKFDIVSPALLQQTP